MTRAKNQLATLDRGEKLIRLVKDGASIQDAAIEIGCSYSIARADFFAWFTIRQEELSELAREVREELLQTLRLDQQRMRKLAIASTIALDRLADAAKAGEADYLQVAAFDVSTAVALMREYQNLTKIILGMVDATGEAAEAHAKRNLQGSGVTTVQALRERLRDSPALARHFIESGIMTELTLAAQAMGHETPIDV